MDRQVVTTFVGELYESARELDRPGRPMATWDELSPQMREWWTLFAQLIADKAEAYVLATVPLDTSKPTPPPRKMLELLKIDRIIERRPQKPARRI